jgi:hypothetical protein
VPIEADPVEAPVASPVPLALVPLPPAVLVPPPPVVFVPLVLPKPLDEALPAV